MLALQAAGTCIWSRRPVFKGKGNGKARNVAGLDEEADEEEEVLGFIELSALDVCGPCGPSSSVSPCCASCLETSSRVIPETRIDSGVSLEMSGSRGNPAKATIDEVTAAVYSVPDITTKKP